MRRYQNWKSNAFDYDEIFPSDRDRLLLIMISMVVCWLAQRTWTRAGQNVITADECGVSCSAGNFKAKSGT